MPEYQLSNIKRALERQNVVVQTNEETDRHLDWAGASGATFESDNGLAVLLHSNPSRATVFEELIHVTQYRRGEIENNINSVANAEIAASEKLLRCAEAYRLTAEEIVETQRNLANWRNKLLKSEKE
jgi:hypothetical protein